MRQEITNFSFKMFDMKFFRYSKCLKIIVELTQKIATRKIALHSCFYVVANVGHCYAVIIEGL